jgi:hypothetical protein
MQRLYARLLNPHIASRARPNRRLSLWQLEQLPVRPLPQLNATGPSASLGRHIVLAVENKHH